MLCELRSRLEEEAGEKGVEEEAVVMAGDGHHA